MLPFPAIRTLDDVLPHIEGRREFLFVEKPEFLVIDYTFIDHKSFFAQVPGDAERHAAAIRRECRGLKFRKADRRLIARPYHKFFNVGEHVDLMPKAVDWRRKHVVLEKLDGSMVHAVDAEGQVVFATRMGATPTAKRALAHAQGQAAIDYLGFCRTLTREGMTPIFEWCSLADRIVIPYESDALILTAVRAVETGAYLTWAELAALGARHGIPVVRAEPVAVGDPVAFIDQVRALDGTEGCVIRFDDGQMLKLKTTGYAMQHRLLSDLDFEKNVLAVICSGRDDDAVAMLPPAPSAALRAYAQAFRAGLRATAADMDAFVAKARAEAGDDRKAFALAVQAALPTTLRAVAFMMWQGKPAQAALVEVVSKNLGTEAAVEHVRSLWGGVRWEVYRPQTEGLRDSG